MNSIRAIAERWRAGQGSSKNGPAQPSTQRLDNFLCFDHLSHTQWVAEVGCTNAALMLVFRWSGKRGDNLFAVNGSSESEHLLFLTSVAVTVTRWTGAEHFNDAQSSALSARLEEITVLMYSGFDLKMFNQKGSVVYALTCMPSVAVEGARVIYSLQWRTVRIGRKSRDDAPLCLGACS